MNVSDRRTETRESSDQPAPNARGTVRNGLVGGVVGVLLSFLPLSPTIGGGVAGYLDRGNGGDGTAAGGVAGLVGFLPYLLVGTYLALSPAVTLPGPALALAPGIVVAGVLSFALVYTVGLGLLGGLLGGFLHEYRSS